MSTSHLSVKHFENETLLGRLKKLAGQDRRLTAVLLAHMAEVDSRGLYRDQAHASMFSYCVSELCMSEAEAYLRIEVARLTTRYPAVLHKLAGGQVHLTAIKLVASLLTQDNHRRLLEAVSGKSKAQVLELVASLDAKPDVPTSIRKLPGRTQSPQPASSGTTSRLITLSLDRLAGWGTLRPGSRLGSPTHASGAPWRQGRR